jgi:hypothetical protein
MAYYETEHLDDFVDNSKVDLLNEAKNLDRGHAKIWGYIERSDGSLRNTKIDVYTSGSMGNHIRDAESGEYYKDIVGSRDEDLYFKVAMATGELKTKNESTTLFYTTPAHCMRHLHIDINPEMITKWEYKRNERLMVKSNMKERVGSILVK